MKRPLKTLIWSMLAMILLGFASVCLYEASTHILMDALAALLFIIAACFSIPFEEAIKALRHDKV